MSGPCYVARHLDPVNFPSLFRPGKGELTGVFGRPNQTYPGFERDENGDPVEYEWEDPEIIARVGE